MNQANVDGKVTQLKGSDKGVSMVLVSGFGEYSNEVPVYFSGGKNGSTEAKKVEILNKYLQEGGQLSVNGSIKTGKNGAYVHATNFFVGSFKPFEKDGGGSAAPAAGKTGKTADGTSFKEDDDLPF